MFYQHFYSISILRACCRCRGGGALKRGSTVKCYFTYVPVINCDLHRCVFLQTIISVLTSNKHFLCFISIFIQELYEIWNTKIYKYKRFQIYNISCDLFISSVMTNNLQCIHKLTTFTGNVCFNLHKVLSHHIYDWGKGTPPTHSII